VATNAKSATKAEAIERITKIMESDVFFKGAPAGLVVLREALNDCLGEMSPAAAANYSGARACLHLPALFPLFGETPDEIRVRELTRLRRIQGALHVAILVATQGL